MREFISEDDILTFEGWVRYQGIDPATDPQELETWRAEFDKLDERRSFVTKVGQMKLRLVPGEYILVLSCAHA
jgi:hypothetical protein